MSIASKLVALGLVGAIGGGVGYGISNSNANKKIENLNNTVLEQEQEISDLKNSLNEKTAMIVLLEGQVEELTSQLNSKQSELEQKQALLSQTQAELEEARAILGENASRIAELENQVSSLQTQIEALQSENADLQDRIDLLQSQLDELQKISFKILFDMEEFNCTAKQGMTWAEYIETENNTSVLGSYALSIGNSGEVICSSSDMGSSLFLFNNGVQVNGSDVIVNGSSYGLGLLTAGSTTFDLWITDSSDGSMGYKYTASENMTWQEFINSEYNVSSNGSFTFEIHEETQYVKAVGQPIIIYNEAGYVKATDVITSTDTYYYSVYSDFQTQQISFIFEYEDWEIGEMKQETLNADKGMTFGDFVANETYNTLGFYADGDYIKSPYGYIVNGEEYIKADSVIVADTTYTRTNFPEGYFDTFTFTINDVEYTSRNYMSWEEWVNSEYNTAGFKNNYNGQILSSDNHIIMLDDSEVSPSDMVMEGLNYTISISLGIDFGGLM